MDRIDSALQELRGRVIEANAAKTPLRLRGAGTKDFYGERCEGALLDMRGYRGVVDYEPSELVITARCGTSLSEVESLLARHQQFLAFEPPAFGADPTIGGIIACGLSGPRRSQAGAARDFVLGAVLLSADGRAAAFRRPSHQERRRLRCRPPAVRLARHPGRHHRGVAQGAAAAARASRRCASRCRRRTPWRASTAGQVSRCRSRPAPGATGRRGCDYPARPQRCALRAPAWAGNCSIPRWPTSGGAACATRRTPSSARPARCGDCRCRPARRRSTAAGTQLIEWGGALRWCASDVPAAELRALASAAGGSAMQWRGGAAGQRFHPLSPALLAIHRRLKAHFDPHRIFNPRPADRGSVGHHRGNQARRLDQGYAARRYRQRDPAHLRALRVLQCDLPHLPAAR